MMWRAPVDVDHAPQLRSVLGRVAHPAETSAALKGLPAIHQRQRKVGFGERGVAEWLDEGLVEPIEALRGLAGAGVETQNHECTQEVHCICQSSPPTFDKENNFARRIIVYLVLQHLDETSGGGEVHGTKVITYGIVFQCLQRLENLVCFWIRKLNFALS